MKKYSKIGIIGCGVMGGTIIKSLIRRGGFSNRNIVVHDVNVYKLKAARKSYGIKIKPSILELVQGIDVLILSIKPQNFQEVAELLKDKISSDVIVISIMAGIGMRALKKGFSHERIVRVMPNTPARVGAGMSVWYASSKINKRDKNSVRNILKSLGKELEVKKEKYVDMATAVSGSGPAYVFYFAGNLIKAANKLGFNNKEADELVKQTLMGSSKLLVESGMSVDELIKIVTSKGGTTEVAIKTLKNKNLDKVWYDAIKSAYNKALLLNKKYE